MAARRGRGMGMGMGISMSIMVLGMKANVIVNLWIPSSLNPGGSFQLVALVFLL